MIGTGASAVQFIPEIAPSVGELLGVPAHAAVARPDARLPRRGRRRPALAATRTCRRTASGTASGSSGGWATACSPACAVDPTWEPNGRVGERGQRHRARRCSPAYLEARVRRPPRPARRRSCRPTRPARSGCCATTACGPARSSATTSSSSPTRIREITPTGVVTADGVEHDVDVIIYGTGFQASKFLTPMKVTGRDGVDLHEQWGGDARAYLGITVPGLPEPVLPLRPEHQHRHQRQHHLLLRVRGALHPRLPRAAARTAATAALDVRKRRARRVQRARRRREPAHGVGLVRREQLVQERARPRRPELAVHAARVLAAHPARPTPTTTC